jgi:uncharacterized membrane protein
MSKHTSWLETEVERWTVEGIITSEQAARIRALYASQSNPVSWGLIVFFGLGAVVIGLGVILLFAYNWDDIPKFGKLALIFAALGASHLGGIRLRAHTDWRANLGEALSLLGTMAFGAGIWLIAQIYHIEEHFPTGFLIWGLGALAMAWAIESTLQGMVATILLATWAGTETMSFHEPVDAAILFIAAAIGPLAWRRRSGWLLGTVLASMYWLLLCNAAYWSGAAGLFAAAFSLSVLLIAVPRYSAPDGFAAWSRGVFSFFGFLGFVLCAYAMSFEHVADATLRWDTIVHRHAGWVLIYRWLLFAAALVAWAGLLLRFIRGERGRVWREDWLCPIALIYAQGMAMFGTRSDDAFVRMVFNLICVGLATGWMVRGCRDGRLRPTVLGSVLLGAILFARYFDLFDSLAARGLVFLVFGGVLFAEGFYYRKLRRAEAGEGGAS